MPLYYKSGSSWTEFNPNPYPIGTLYYATKDVSPAPLVGGTWTKGIIDNKGELVGYVAEATDPDGAYGYVLNYSFFYSGSKVTGTFTWHQGTSFGGNNILLFSEFPTVSSYQIAGSVNGTQNISINTEGQLVLQSNFGLASRRDYPVSISYTSNQILGTGASFVYERTA